MGAAIGAILRGDDVMVMVIFMWSSGSGAGVR